MKCTQSTTKQMEKKKLLSNKNPAKKDTKAFHGAQICVKNEIYNSNFSTHVTSI